MMMMMMMLDIPEELGNASRRGSHLTPALQHGTSDPLQQPRHG